jgi:hypothetical protein
LTGSTPDQVKESLGSKNSQYNFAYERRSGLQHGVAVGFFSWFFFEGETKMKNANPRSPRRPSAPLAPQTALFPAPATRRQAEAQIAYFAAQHAAATRPEARAWYAAAVKPIIDVMASLPA